MPRVALVYPPFGPTAIPSLGLGILSAGLKRRGIDCRTFYWNLDVVDRMPGRTFDEKLLSNTYMSFGYVWPFNEWIFAPIVYGDDFAPHEARGRAYMETYLTGARASIVSRADILSLRDRACDLVDEMVDRLEPYDVLGISSTFYQNLASLALATRYKARWPDRKVVLGGANCDGEMGRALMEQFGVVDHAFVGEVDHSFPDFVEKLGRGESTAGQPGMLGREDGRVVAGPPSPPLADMDSLPYPDFDDYMEVFDRLGLGSIHELCLPLESSRGCWWGAKQHCTFCGLNANGMNFRQKSQDRFSAEVEHVRERYGAKYYFVVDNILSMDYYDRFMDWSIEKDLGLHYFYEIKANLSRKQVARLARSGITLLQPGIESLSSEVLALMRKGVKGIQNVALLKYAREYGVIPTWNILSVFPNEDPACYERMADVVEHFVHLRPPSGLRIVEYHRFSPYHNDPDAFGIRLRPAAKYGYIYPFDDAVLRRIAYMFEREDFDQLDLSYLDRLREKVQFWIQNFRFEDCTLVWRWDEGDVLIDDRRPRHPRRQYRLSGWAIQVFLAIDAPRAIPGILREAESVEVARPAPAAASGSDFLNTLFGGAAVAAAPAVDVEEVAIDFDREAFEADPAGCLARFVEPGLAYLEDGRYLSLPVAEDFKPIPPGWYDLIVRM